jgi:cell wall integrity and stress response component
MGLRSRAFLAGGLGFAAAFVVACGGSNDLLSGDQANTLSSQLDAVSAAVNSGNCAAAGTAADKFTSAVGSLTSPVSSKLVQSLGDGAVKLKQLAAQDCSSTSSTSSSRSSSTTTTQSTSTTTTTVTSTPSTSSSSTTAQSTTATNPASPGTTSAPSGGAGLGGGTGTTGNGGNGQ